jgi:hypothetical protein
MNWTAGLRAWSWIFVSLFSSPTRIPAQSPTSQILEGIATVFVGILALFGKYSPGMPLDTFNLTESPALVLVDYPQTATFLTPEERAFVIWRKSMSLFAMLKLIVRTVSFFDPRRI